jgi:riboflavin kinase / FMN adenylyltransferase
MDVVPGVDALRPEHGPVFAVIGVFDGLHRGHTYLLDHLVREARTREARATVITFDHHPDEVLTGSAPPMLLHPDDRLDRLAEAGVDVTVVQHFDEAVRRTTYDAFIDSIRRGTSFVGLLMTPDAAFGFERRGTPAALTELGKRLGFDVVVIAPFAMDGAPVSSSQIRSAIERGDLTAAKRLLGRPVAYRGTASDGSVTFDWPMAMPPDGRYEGRIDGRPANVVVKDGAVRIDGNAADGTVRLELIA